VQRPVAVRGSARGDSRAAASRLGVDPALALRSPSRWVSSIFMAKELGVEVWAVDRGVDPSANQARIAAHGCERSVFPVRADVRDLPFSHGFFDAAVAFDSYLY
jgi:hypothetical protein